MKPKFIKVQITRPTTPNHPNLALKKPFTKTEWYEIDKILDSNLTLAHFITTIQYAHEQGYHYTIQASNKYTRWKR